MANIYVVRHGETKENMLDLINGRNDGELTEVGKEQAQRVAEQLKNENIDLIIASPLKRTKQTAEIINIKGIETIYDDRIIERDTGELMYKPISILDLSRFYDVGLEKYDNIEGFKSILKRVEDLFEDIRLKYADKNILIVTHGDVCKAINSYFNKIYDADKIKNLQQENCEIIKYNLN